MKARRSSRWENSTLSFSRNCKNWKPTSSSPPVSSSHHIHLVPAHPAMLMSLSLSLCLCFCRSRVRCGGGLRLRRHGGWGHRRRRACGHNSQSRKGHRGEWTGSAMNSFLLLRPMWNELIDWLAIDLGLFSSSVLLYVVGFGNCKSGCCATASPQISHQGEHYASREHCHNILVMSFQAKVCGDLKGLLSATSCNHGLWCFSLTVCLRKPWAILLPLIFRNLHYLEYNNKQPIKRQ